MDEEIVHVFMVDDDEDDYVLTRDLLAEAVGARFELEWVDTYQAALEAMGRAEHDVYLVDYRLGEQDGLELLRAAIASGCEAPIVILTGRGDHAVDVAAMKAGAADYLDKGELSAQLLERSIRYAIERQRAEEKLEHLNLVLRAIRSVNQFIVREKDRARLLQGVCDHLIETRGYHNAWSALFDEAGKLVATAEAGLGEEFTPLAERLKRGEWTTCGRRALAQSEVVVTEDPLATCVDCPLAKNYGGRGALTIRLEHGGQVYGLLSASIPAHLTADREEQALFREVARDIAFALHDIELEEKRQRAEEALGERVKELTCLYAVSRNMQEDLSVDELCRRAVEHLVPAMRFSEITVPVIELDGRRFTSERYTEGLSHGLQAEIIVKGKARGQVWVYYAEEKPFLIPEEQSLLNAVVEDLGLWLERQQAEEALRESEANLARAQQIAHLGNWDWDVKGQTLTWSDEVYRIFGVGKEFELTYEGIKAMIHPDDREKNQELVNQLLTTSDFADIEFRMIRPDGAVRHIYQNAEVSRDEAGNVSRVFGIMQDITDRKQAEEALKQKTEQQEVLLSSIPAFVYFKDTESKLIIANKEFAEMVNTPIDKLPGKDAYDLFPKEQAEKFHVDDRKVMESGRPTMNIEEEFTDAEGKTRWASSSKVPYFDEIGEIVGMVGITVDITERKRAEEELRQRVAQAALAYEVGRRVSSKLELDELLSEIVTAVRDAFDYYGVMILLVNEKAKCLTMQSIAGGYTDIFPRDLCHAIGEGMTGYAAASGQTQVAGDVSQHPHYVREADEETRSELAVPIKSRQKVIGVLDLQSDQFEAFDEIDVMAMETLADQVAVAIENAQLYEAVQQELAERKRAEEELRQSHVKLRGALEGTVNVLVSAIELRDPYTAGHQRRSTQLACAIAKEMGFSQEQVEVLRMAGLIHDIGKITIPAEILSKPSQLRDIEWALIKAHPEVGYNILKAVEFPWPVAEIVLQHHERLNGSGYPQGLSGNGILIRARILAVADVVEAMASHRPYRPTRGLDMALEEVSQNRGVLYDPEAVDACLKLFAEKGFEFE